MSDIIDITSPNELPKGKEFYLFSDLADLALIAGSPDLVIYRLTRKIKKEYVEYFVENK